MASKPKGKLRKTISIDRIDFEYVESEIETGRFDSLSHAVRAGIIWLRKEEEIKLILLDYRRVMEENRRIIEELKKQASH